MCVAAAIGGAALVGVVMQSRAAKHAASTQAAAANAAEQTQQGMYQQTRSDLMPYNRAGQSATQALMAFYGLPGGKGPSSTQLGQNLQNLPGMQFMQQFGSEAVDRSQAAKGLLNSGATGMAQQRFGQGLAANYALPMYLGGLQSIAGQGENAAAQTGAFATKAGEGIAGSQMAAGSAMASGQMGSANAWSAGLQGLGGAYGMYGPGGLWSQYQNMQRQQGFSPYAQTRPQEGGPAGMSGGPFNTAGGWDPSKMYIS